MELGAAIGSVRIVESLFELITELSLSRTSSLYLATRGRKICLRTSSVSGSYGIVINQFCIGPNSAALFAAELIDIRYFPTPNGLVRWAGLNLNVDQFGVSEKSYRENLQERG